MPMPDNRGSPLLELDGVQVHYGKVEALKGISFNVNEGEIVTLIGANGAGKTTTLKTISGVRPLTRGHIRFQGQDIGGVPAYRRVELGISQAPEGRGIFPGMTVRENLDMGAYARKGKARAGLVQELDTVFDLFPRLRERASQMAGTLSGGEQQMLAIGRALMSKPKVLLLDEPSMGLAPKLVAQIFSIITEINKQGTTVLLVEQNAAQALQRASRAYVLEVGKVVMAGPAAELLDNQAVRAAYLGGDVGGHSEGDSGNRVIVAVLLDVGGVITTPDHDMLRGPLEAAGATPSAASLDRAHYAGAAALDAGFLATGKLDWRRYDAAVARTVGVPEDRVAEAVEGLEAAWHRVRGWHRIVPGSLEGLRQLAATGVDLGVVSNADGTVADQLVAARVCQVGEGHGVSVAVVIDSTVVGVEKPDPRIFTLALDALQIPPDQNPLVVHVGDTVFADVNGARAAGLRPLHLDPYGDCPAPVGDHEHVRSLAEVAELVRRSQHSRAVPR